ncbi:hypothetical protein [Hyperthermus butylicus]|uniref:hypothetical protein n=1 Tax=Hyperthermus butylicus TaxID=54248 RepID=UPI0003239630|nr:hypothetical protein [Hyperthermus butylicus]
MYAASVMVALRRRRLGRSQPVGRRGPGPSEDFLREASEAVQPIHGQGFFYVGYGYIAYYIVFDYNDPLGYYEAVLRNPKLYEEETLKLYYGMQELVDQEEVKVNGERVRPKVAMVDIGFRGRSSRVYIVFALRFRAPIRPGVNVYENRYEPEPIEYDYEAYWVFPPGSRILEVDMGTGSEDWEIVDDNVLAIYGKRGGRTGGYEKIVFRMPEKPIMQDEE